MIVGICMINTGLTIGGPAFVGDDDLSMLSQIGSKARLTDLSTQFMRLCRYTCMDGICLSLRLLNSAPAEAEGSYVRCGLRLVSSSMTSAISKQFQSTLLTVELSSVTGLFQPQVQMIIINEPLFSFGRIGTTWLMALLGFDRREAGNGLPFPNPPPRTPLPSLAPTGRMWWPGLDCPQGLVPRRLFPLASTASAIPPLSMRPSPGPISSMTIFCSVSLSYCVCCFEVTVTSLHPPRLCRIAVFSVKPTFLSWPTNRRPAGAPVDREGKRESER